MHKRHMVKMNYTSFSQSSLLIALRVESQMRVRSMVIATYYRSAGSDDEQCALLRPPSLDGGLLSEQGCH